jgi:mono/diheme cytochrome c family protein
MKKYCLILLVALIAASPLTLRSEDAPDGAYLFKARCGTCHGEKGEGLESAKIPAINGTPITVDKLVMLITEGKSGKRVHYSPIVNIDEAGAKAIAEYIKKMK